MKKLLRIVGIIAAIIILFAVGVAAFYFLYYPKVEKAPQLTVERTLGRIERGKYLANHVSMCIECHSERNFDYFAGPIVKGTEGKGGEHFGADEGVPADLYAPNITPAGVAGTLTDGELLRTITSGVRKDNSVLFPLMPYSRFNKLTDEDLYSIIAYVRTLPPIENQPPKSSINFPVNIFIRAVPTTHTSVPEPNRSNKLEYGKYLVNAAVCAACHTPMEKGQPKQGMDFAGGREFITTFGTIRTANITPDEQTGIGNWTEDFFVDRFKYYDQDSARVLNPKQIGYRTVMPWTQYAGMSEDDLRAIYTYLRSVPPITHPIVKYEPLTEASKQ